MVHNVVHPMAQDFDYYPNEANPPRDDLNSPPRRMFDPDGGTATFQYPESQNMMPNVIYVGESMDDNIVDDGRKQIVFVRNKRPTPSPSRLFTKRNIDGSSLDKSTSSYSGT